MKTFAVSLDIVTISETLAELSGRLRMRPSPTSHDRGSRRAKGVWEETVWRLESSAGETASLDEHCRWIFDRFPIATLRRPAILPSDAQVCLNIAIFFDTAMASLLIPSKYIDILYASGSNVEVSCYPCTDDTSDATPKPKVGKTARRKPATRKGNRVRRP